MPLLFEYRAIFRTVAAREIPVGCSSSPVICWVDVMLARISSLVEHPECTCPHLPSLQKQKEDDMLRAATQLPGLRFFPTCRLAYNETCVQFPGLKQQVGSPLKTPLLLLVGCPSASPLWYMYYVRQALERERCWRKNGRCTRFRSARGGPNILVA